MALCLPGAERPAWVQSPTLIFPPVVMAGSLGSEMLSGGSSLPGRGRRKSSPEAGQLSLTAPTGSCAPHPKRRPVPVPGVLWGTHPHVGRTIRTYRINSFLLAVWELSLLFISWACSLFYVLFLTFPWQQRRKDGAIKRRYMLFSFHNLRGRRAVVRNSHDSSFWKLLTTEASRSPQFCLTGGGEGGKAQHSWRSPLPCLRTRNGSSSGVRSRQIPS